MIPEVANVLTKEVLFLRPVRRAGDPEGLNMSSTPRVERHSADAGAEARRHTQDQAMRSRGGLRRRQRPGSACRETAARRLSKFKKPHARLIFKTGRRAAPRGRQRPGLAGLNLHYGGCAPPSTRRWSVQCPRCIHGAGIVVAPSSWRERHRANHPEREIIILSKNASRHG